MPTIPLSNLPEITGPQEGRAVALVGSFAPVHEGHLDALLSAALAVERVDDSVNALTLVPNSSEYVRRKLGDVAGLWRFRPRVDAIMRTSTSFDIPTYVDDISGRVVGLDQINHIAPLTIEQSLGFDAARTYFVVGSDQLMTMEEHLSGTNNRAVCVERPGRHEEVKQHLQTSWVKEALVSGRFLVTSRANMAHDISSTNIRCADATG